MEHAIQKIIDKCYQDVYENHKDLAEDLDKLLVMHQALCKKLVKTVSDIHEEKEQLQTENEELNALLHKFETQTC